MSPSYPEAAQSHVSAVCSTSYYGIAMSQAIRTRWVLQVAGTGPLGQFSIASISRKGLLHNHTNIQYLLVVSNRTPTPNTHPTNGTVHRVEQSTKKYLRKHGS